jgi:hypothetical protein
MRDTAPLFPTSLAGRLRLAVESVFFLCVGAYSVFNWPPVGVVAQGVWVDIFLALVFELMLAMIPLGLLGLLWAVAMPEWIRTTLKRISGHADVVIFVFVGLGLLGMIAGALGWW